MNSVVISGNIVREVKLEKTKNGKPMIRNVIAVNDNWNDEKYKKTYFINFEIFERDCIKDFKSIKKGNLVELQGKLIVENYQDKDGNWHNITKLQIFKVIPIEVNKKKKEFDKVDDDFMW